MSNGASIKNKRKDEIDLRKGGFVEETFQDSF
jgi:hypothetical protein